MAACLYVAALSAVALLPRRRPRRSAIMGLTSKSALYSEGPSCQVHPQVLFSIVDHFSRREGGQNRVIGTLLGTVGADGVVEVDSCFPVPHTETEEQVAVNTDFHATMLQLHQRVHPKQKVVGWYSTGEEVNDSSILFHDFYGQGVERPVHLLLDLGLGETRMSCKAYVSTQLKLGATVLGTSFSDIKCTVVSAESDRIGMEALMKTANSGGQLAGSTAASPMAEVDSMELTVKKLLRTLDAVIAHVEKARASPPPARPSRPFPPASRRLPDSHPRTPPDRPSQVKSKAQPADPAVVRLLQDVVAAAPRLPAAAFEKMFNSQVQDMLVVVYLANLTRTQLALAEKLQAVAISSAR